MEARRKLCGFYLHVGLCIVLVFYLQASGCLSLNIEGLALLDFRSKVVLDPHGMLENWSPVDSDPCKWLGVRCVDGKVDMLNLNGLSLQGVLSPELGELSHLRALLLYNNNFSGIIPKELGKLHRLELLDLRSNNLSGTVPAEIVKLSSLKHLLLYNNTLQGSVRMLLRKPKMISKSQFDGNFSFSSHTTSSCINRKVGECFLQHKKQQSRLSNISFVLLKRNIMKFLDVLVLSKYWKGSLHKNGEEHSRDLKSFSKAYIVYEDKYRGNSHHRILLQVARNLPAAAPVDSAPIAEMGDVPSSGSGSFLAVATAIGEKKPKLSTISVTSASPIQHSNANQTLSSQLTTNGQSPVPLESHLRTGKDHAKWTFMVVIIIVVLSLLIASILLVGGSRKKRKTDLRKAGLSAKLQKALTKALTEGIPKLTQEELELACEDFCNIIQSDPEYTVYKGTLCSGVEIAVLSSMVSSPKDWTKHMEMEFRKKIDTLSRVNHKNFVNLLGYCDDDEPFVRMMVFEYAPSGTLSEHIHDKGFEHLDWGTRMRIIMGIAYCLQYMHHELNPPVVHQNLQSKAIFLTDDYAAKISEIDFWKKVVTNNGKISGDDKMESEVFPADPAGNVHDFGVLLLEIIAGQETYSQEHGSIADWASEKLNDASNLCQLIDPTLKAFKDDQLTIICEVIKECIYLEPKKRPSMKDVATKLQQVLMISPDSAAPRLSPLWWAELEILSHESS